jgi:hypothetical protein
MEHWYVYYKLSPAELDACKPQLAALLRSVESLTGVSGCLQMRVDVTGGMATVMEVYPSVADAVAFGRALDQALDRSGLGATRLNRRIERFRAL